MHTRPFIFIAILSTLMIPTEMLVIPWYLMSQQFGWLDTHWGIMFPGLMTAFGTVEAAVESMKAGAYSYLCKPFRMDEMASILRNISREISLENQVDSLRDVIRRRYSSSNKPVQTSRVKEFALSPGSPGLFV